MWCHLLINTFFRLGMAGLYSVTKGNIFFRPLFWFLTAKWHFLIIEDIRTLLSLFHNEDLINDNEFLLLHEQYSPTKPDFLYHVYPGFDLEQFYKSECLAEFRCRKRDIVALRDVLQISAITERKQRCVCNDVQCIHLWLLSYRCRYGNMMQRFAKPVVPILCIAVNKFDHIYNQWI